MPGTEEYTDRAENKAQTASAPRGLVGAAAPAGEIIHLLDDQNMQTEKLLTIIGDLGVKLMPVMDVSDTDRASEDPQKQPNSSVGQGILRNTDNVKRAQGLLVELLNRVQL